MADEDEDEEIQRCFEEWKREFQEEQSDDTDFSDDEDENEEGMVVGDHNGAERISLQGHELKHKDPLSNPSVDKIFTDSPFDLEVNWRYGSHISSVDPFYRNQLKESNTISASDSPYSQSLLPSLGLLDDFKSDQTICSQFEVSQMTLLMLSGVSSDIFAFVSREGAPAVFSLTPTGSRIRIPELTSSTLMNYLRWFLELGNRVQLVRRQLHNETSELNLLEQSRDEKEGPSSLFLQQMVGPVTASLRETFSTFQALLVELQRQIPDSSVGEDEIVPGHLTLIHLFYQLRSWAEVFELSLVGITRTLSRIASSRMEREEVIASFPVLKMEDTNAFENRDFIHHINVSSLMTQLLSGISSAHLISAQLSTVSTRSSLDSLGQDISSVVAANHLTSGSYLPVQSTSLPCFTSLVGAYLKHFFIWIFQTDRPIPHRSSVYSSQSHFGGLAYDHSLTSLISPASEPAATSPSSWSQFSSRQMTQKFNHFPALWIPLLAFGAMTKVNIQVLVKQGVERSLKYSQLREYVSAAERAICSVQILLQRSAIRICLPFVNPFTRMVDESVSARVNPSSSAPQSLCQDLFTTPLVLSKATAEMHPVSALRSCPIAVPASLLDLCEILPSLNLLLAEFCLGPLSDTLLISQQHALRALLGKGESPSRQSFHLLDHLQFVRKVFLLGDPLLYEPLWEFLQRQTIDQRQQRQSFKPVAQDLISLIEQNIHSSLPPSLMQSHVVIKERYESTTGKESVSDKTAILYHLLDSIHIEIHYLPPLSSIFSPEVLSVYSNCLSLLLRLQCSIWSGEILWKQVISSSSSALQRQGYSLHDSIPTETTFMSFRDITRSCVSGLHWLLHVLRALRHFYLHEIHHVCWSSLMDFISSDRCSCVEDLLSSHEGYLTRIQSLLTFLRPRIEELLRRGLKCILSLEEMNAVLETEEQVSRYAETESQSLDPFDDSRRLLESRFKQLFREFKAMTSELRTLTRTITEICTKSPSPSSPGQEELTGHLSFYYANALRMLIGS